MRRALIAGFAGALCLCPPAQAGLPQGFVGLYGDRDLASVAHVGVETVRQPLEWSRVERSPGQFDFSAYDGFVAEAARAGVNVLPVLMGPPPFRSSMPPGSRSRAMFPPKSNAAFAAFAGAVVRRYGVSGSFWAEHTEVPFLPIHSWQVWNEPNIPNFWRSGPDARRYVALLRAAARAIRRVDPDAEVVAAGLPNSHLGVPFLRYLQAMYRAGAKGSFDTLAIHPYSRNVEGLLALVERARRVMNRHGDRARLWITEFGWSTGGDASAFRVGERGQADRIGAAVSALVAERRLLRLRGFVLFQWRDAVAPPEARLLDVRADGPRAAPQRRLVAGRLGRARADLATHGPAVAARARRRGGGLPLAGSRRMRRDAAPARCASDALRRRGTARGSRAGRGPLPGGGPAFSGTGAAHRRRAQTGTLRRPDPRPRHGGEAGRCAGHGRSRRRVGHPRPLAREAHDPDRRLLAAHPANGLARPGAAILAREHHVAVAGRAQPLHDHAVDVRAQARVPLDHLALVAAHGSVAVRKHVAVHQGPCPGGRAAREPLGVADAADVAPATDEIDCANHLAALAGVGVRRRGSGCKGKRAQRCHERAGTGHSGPLLRYGVWGGARPWAQT
jgi:hypothetical protein